MISTIKHTLIGLLFTSVLVSADVDVPEGNPQSNHIQFYKQGNLPANLKDDRNKWLKALEQMPENARLSDFRRLFDTAKRIGVKDLKSLNQETWEIDASFFVIFETHIEDLGLKDPRLVGKIELHHFTFVEKLPTMEELLNRSKANWFTTIQPKTEQGSTRSKSSSK